jgi:hypothetical protein
LRVTGLTHLDPLAVPLPAGTEVTTRVDRTLGERVVPQGAVGRVVASHAGGAVDVQLIGIGMLQYQRAELLPRKLGQARFAHRREAAWSALRPCIVLEAVVGSRAWGLSDEASDTDRRGVFVLPFSWTTGLADPPVDLQSADASATYWEIAKAIRQGLRADPNTLELLFVPGVRALDPLGEWLLEARDAFVSTEIHGTFGRYALSQLRKMERALRLAEHRAVVLEWLRSEPPPSLDEIAGRLAAHAHLGEGADALLRAKTYVKQLYGSLFDQGLLASRDFAGLRRFAREASHDFELPRDLRPKNAYNLIRLLHTGIVWLRHGVPDLEVSGELRETLLAIKRGEWPLSRVVALAEDLAPALETARNESPLSSHPDLARADALLRRVREEAARRWAGNVPGPFGASAPLPPEAAWETR